MKENDEKRPRTVTYIATQDAASWLTGAALTLPRRARAAIRDLNFGTAESYYPPTSRYVKWHRS